MLIEPPAQDFHLLSNKRFQGHDISVAEERLERLATEPMERVVGRPGEYGLRYGSALVEIVFVARMAGRGVDLVEERGIVDVKFIGAYANDWSYWNKQ